MTSTLDARPVTFSHPLALCPLGWQLAQGEALGTKQGGAGRGGEAGEGVGCASPGPLPLCPASPGSLDFRSQPEMHGDWRTEMNPENRK